MAGETWAGVKAYLASLPVASLRAAANDWNTVADAVSAASTVWVEPDIVLKRTWAVSAAAYELLTKGQQAYDFVDGLGRGLGSSSSPGGSLLELANWVGYLQRRMAEDEQGGTAGFGAYPDPSYVPATPAGSVIRDAVLQDFDERAGVYLVLLNDKVRQVAADIDQKVQATWPEGLPAADPDAPRPTG